MFEWNEKLPLKLLPFITPNSAKPFLSQRHFVGKWVKAQAWTFAWIICTQKEAEVIVSCICSHRSLFQLKLWKATSGKLRTDVNLQLRIEPQTRTELWGLLTAHLTCTPVWTKYINISWWNLGIFSERKTCVFLSCPSVQIHTRRSRNYTPFSLVWKLLQV